MTFYPNERIGLFIDGANLYSAVKALDFDIDYRKLLQEFRSRGKLIRANYYTALLDQDEYSSMSIPDKKGYHVCDQIFRQRHLCLVVSGVSGVCI